jgi:uncharacterized protein VirK/YbjX
MEGELQLRFSFRSDLCVLTFLVVRGETFNAGCPRALFIGGVQGRPGGREEMRDAARANDEIAPPTMLMLAVQAIGKAIGAEVIIGVAEDDHISTSYSPARLMFDYSRFWSEAGGERNGSYYRIPIDTPAKPLSEIPLTHRRRTKRKREAKQRAKLLIAHRLRSVIQARFDFESIAIAAE